MQSNVKHHRKRIRAFCLATGIIFSSMLFALGMVKVYAKEGGESNVLHR